MRQSGRQDGAEYKLLRRSEIEISSTRPGEELVWVDKFGTLMISKIDQGENSAFSLRLGSQIRVNVVPGRPTTIEAGTFVTDETIEHFLDDQVLPRLESGAGKFVLHSAAIDIGGTAILLLGDSGRGKSTLAASFQQQGFRLLGDDAIVLNEADGSVLARAVYASLRLLPDSLKAIFPSDTNSSQVSQHSPKRSVSFGSPGADNPIVPVAAAFVLSNEAADRPCLQRIGKADACMELVKNSFALDPADAKMGAAKLSFAVRVATGIPLYSFSYPRDFSKISEARSTLLNVLAYAT